MRGDGTDAGPGWLRLVPMVVQLEPGTICEH